MKPDSPLFDRIRVKPDKDRRLRSRAAALRMAGLRGGGDPSRPQGAAARERVLAVLPRSRARVQSLVQFLRRHERRRDRQIPEGRDHRSSPDLEDGHERRPADRALPFGPPASGSRRRRRSVRGVPRLRRSPAHEADSERLRRRETRVIRNAERKALEVLGLEADATTPEIKARFKELVKRHHPDANGGDRSTEDRLPRHHPGLQLLEISRLSLISAGGFSEPARFC